MNLATLFGGMIPLFILGHFSHHVLTAITVPLMPFIRGTFALDYTQSGFVLSAFTLAYGIGQLPAGWLADRIDPRKLLVVGISGVALAGILVGLSHAYLPMVIFLVVMGFLAGGYHPAAPPLISALSPPEHLGRSLGLHNIGGGASNILTPLIAVALANAWGWRNAYLGLAVPTFLFGALFYLLLGRFVARAERRSGGVRKKEERPVQPESLGRIVVFLFLSTFTAAVVMSATSFVPLIMIDHFGQSKETAAALLSLTFTAVFWAGPLGGYFGDRFGSIPVTIAICSIAGPVLILFTILPYGWGIYVLLLLVGTVVFARMAASEMFIVSQAPPGSRSTILGIYYFAGTEGGGILTPLLGYAIDRFGFPTAFTVAGGAAIVVTLLCSLWLLRGKRG
ncbi:MAG: MFS transporter [Syntrophales bacterium]